ncbi:hypothetical protein BC938DRAFT_473700 [Jimgerdemannia flammicorona]|uniref:Uncharacterized protein n=1 Tax=Jimgerdemannia flammicorona TaxID=994334 RepID=A0A433Q3X2_9FUNG|nr:hypothetical protein BC938DRAFT_473700 [Jimgerdemannia flammicorona]
MKLDNTLTQNTTTRQSSILPPEIVREIVEHVSHDLTVDLPTRALNLLACSLVCSTWYNEVLPFVRRYFAWNQGVTMRLSDSNFHFLHSRLADLLAESRRLHLAQCTFIISLNIPLSTLICQHSAEESTRQDRKLSETYMKIIRNAPKLAYYRFTYDIDAVSDESGRDIDDFFNKAGPLCKAITHLELRQKSAEDLVTFNPCFIGSIADHLVYLRITGSLIGPARQALRLCYRLKIVRLNIVRFDLNWLVPLVASWPNLRVFIMHTDRPGLCDDGDEDSSAGQLALIEKLDPDLAAIIASPYPKKTVDDLITALAASCHLLEDLNLRTRGLPYEKVSNGAMRGLIDSCFRTLKFLRIEGQTLYGDFLRDLTRCRQLKAIYLREYRDVVGGELPPSLEELWPHLHFLRLSSCASLEWAFIERVLLACGRLRMVELPWVLSEEREKFMAKIGFEKDNCGKTSPRNWRRASEPVL